MGLAQLLVGMGMGEWATQGTSGNSEWEGGSREGGPSTLTESSASVCGIPSNVPSSKLLTLTIMIMILIY